MRHALLLYALVLIPAAFGLTAAEEVDWWRAQEDLNAQLASQRTTVAALAASLATSKPKTGQEAMVKLSVLMRAGMNKDAIAALKELKALCPDLRSYQFGSIYYEACDHLKAWEVARSVVETYAETFRDVSLENRLLRHFAEAGWEVDRIDQWLASMPAERNGYWIKERLRFNTQHGRGEPLVRQLIEGVKTHPEDAANAIAFLDALVYSGCDASKTRDLSWMVETVKPRLAMDQMEIAAHLKTLQAHEPAIAFFLQAIETPLADAEVQRLGMHCQVEVAEERLRAGFSTHVREELAACLLQVNRKDEAQKWMVEAADLRAKHGLGANSLFAGQVQGASGQRVVEERIKEAEKKSESDPAYWQERARYYRGRNEAALEEEALKKGLALTAPQPDPEHRFKTPLGWRASLLGDYAHFLSRVGRTDEAIVLLRKELTETPANSESTIQAARLLAFEFDRQLRADDEALWTWLGQRPRWEHVEQRLLWRLLEKAGGADREGWFVKAEELTRKQHPSRAHTLGWVMNRMQEARRSIPLLQDAVDRADEQELKERASFSLFESFLDTNDWKRAEAIFPAASGQLSSAEQPEWRGRIAVAAAKAGAREEAVRIWKAVLDQNPSELRNLDELAQAGLSAPIAELYRELQRKLPSSDIPTKALKELGMPQDAP